MPYREIKVKEGNLWFLGCLTPYQFFPDEYNDISPSSVLIPSDQVDSHGHARGNLLRGY